jgi:hypothetical protein
LISNDSSLTDIKDQIFAWPLIFLRFALDDLFWAFTVQLIKALEAVNGLSDLKRQ